MGLVKATFGAVAGTLADQWKDFLTVPEDIWPTAALFPAVKSGTNVSRGSNVKGSTAIVTNGSKIVVPEGFGLLILQDGKLTAFSAEPGSYIWNSDDIQSKSIFSGDGARASIINQSWSRFKFGGLPGSQQLAIFVRLQELPDNRFGTQAPVYWDDAYFKTQVGVMTRGTYSLRIVDPIRFAMSFVPATYLQGFGVFDFTDLSNPFATQLFNEVVGCLAAAFSQYSNADARVNRITKIQQDAVNFSTTLADVVETSYQWRDTRGIEITKATLVGVEYDEVTRGLISTIQRADALTGARGSANLQASVAAGIESAGTVGGSDGILGVGIAAGAIGLPSLFQQAGGKPSPVEQSPSPDLVESLTKLKQARDADLITESDYEAAKSKLLGLD